MSQKKYQVFVSSTFRDLLDERQDAIRNILDLNHIPAGMELFPAADVDQLDYIKKVIDECDYYLLIMGGRYGSMDSNGISYTEREYDYAVETGKTVIAFVHDDPSAIPVGKSDVEPGVVEALTAFRCKVMTGRLVKSWNSKQQLEPLVLKSLIHAFNNFPQIGWIRGDSAASDELIEKNNSVLQENADLRAEIFKLRQDWVPSVPDIADLEDVFLFRYHWQETDHWGHSDFHEASCSLTWKGIFLGVAGQLDKPQSGYCIVEGVKEAMKEANALHELVDLNVSDKVRIKVQFSVLGLIETEVSNIGEANAVELIKLSEKGRKVFVEGMVVRKKSELV